MLPLVRKYAPKSLRDVEGQPEAVASLKDFTASYASSRKKAALLHGPSGTGKTSSIHALADDLGFEVFEINASDFRNKDALNSKLGSAIHQRSLFSRGKLILVDEIDALSGTKDRGALPELLRLMQSSTYPLFLTLQNPYSHKFSSLRSKCELVEFHPLPQKALVSLLARVAKQEKMKIEENALSAIARRSGGDARAALNDLEILSTLSHITLEHLEELGMREKQENILQALVKVLKSTDFSVASGAFDYLKEDVDEQLLWLDANLPKEYEKPADLARAYDSLSRADVFRGRIRRWQHWRFLVYINTFLTAGVAVAKDAKYEKFVQYKPTGRILKMWWAKQKSLKKRAIAEKIAQHTHTSARQTIKSFPFYQAILRKGAEAAEQLGLDREEIAWLKKES